MRSGAPKAREQVRGTCKSEERRELGRAAGELPEASSLYFTELNSNIHVLAQPARNWRLGLRYGRSGGRGGLLERQSRKTLGRGGGFFQGGREIGLTNVLGRCLRHLKPRTGLAGGLLGGNQGGADLHPPNLTKQG